MFQQHCRRKSKKSSTSSSFLTSRITSKKYYFFLNDSFLTIVSVNLTYNICTVKMSNDLVECSTHKRRRLAKYCIQKPIYNAEQEVVGFCYECAPGSTCSVTSPTAAHGLSVGGLSLPNIVGSPTSPGEATKVFPGGPARYYDMLRTGSERDIKKVCFACGQEGHERPTCPNILCRACHCPIGPGGYNGHQCQPVCPSPFVEPVYNPAELKHVQCVICNEFGHVDCGRPLPLPNWTPTCLYCAGAGHHAFHCKYTPPDKWQIRVQEAVRRELNHLRTGQSGFHKKKHYKNY